MRTTLQIIIANKEGEPCTQQELSYALEALSGIEHVIKQDLLKLIEVIENDKPTVKMRAAFSKETVQKMFDAIKKPPDEWLQPHNLPGSPELLERIKFGKRLFKKATGEDL